MNTPPASHAEVLRECRRILDKNSKSFALASRLLPPGSRDKAAAVYAYCRRVDDAIDEAPPESHAQALRALHEELDLVYEGAALTDPALRAFQAVVATCNLPRHYPAELIAGMAMDVEHAPYEKLEDLLLYCHRVAGVVGLMMCHVFGITRDDALRPAAQLGLAMQLTNICRDVEEDWRLGRVYLPRAMLREEGATALLEPGRSEFPRDAATLAAMRRVMRRLLDEADRYYASADRGIAALPFRAGLAVRAARRLYHAIGILIAEGEYDPRRGRAIVPTPHKVRLLGRALAEHVTALPLFAAERVRALGRARPPARELRHPEDRLA